MRLRALFPGWRIEEDTAVGSVGDEIVKRAQEWDADVIVLGSHGYRTIPRLFLGSVSHQVLKHAACSVRVGRHGRYDAQIHTLRLLVGYDGSACSRAAVTAVASRTWPPGTEVRVLMAVEAEVPASVPIMGSYPAMLDPEARAERCVVEARQELSKAGLKVTHTLQAGDAKHLILDAAEGWGADCIFVGSHGRSGLARLFLGSVSLGVAESAGCSVEVVRCAVPQM